jgi:excisionase family DNA binding protein
MIPKDVDDCTPLLLTIPQFARRVGLQPPSIRQWIAQQKLETVKLGRRRMIPTSEVTRLIEENRRPRLRQPATTTAA